MVTVDDDPLRIRILGRVSARLGEGEVDLGPPKQRALAALLALKVNGRVGTDEVVTTLWPDNPPRSAPQLVHTYVARLRQALEPSTPRRHRTTVISSVSGGYRLNLVDDAFDLLTFRKLTRQARYLVESDQWEPAFALLVSALDQWEDVSLSELAALLPNRLEVAQLHQEWVAAGTDLVGLGLAHDRTAVVLPVAEQLARLEPLNETVQVCHLEALGRTGQRAAALTTYAEVRSRLRGELGVDPGPQLARTFQDLLDTPAPEPPQPRPAVERRLPPPWRGYGAAVEDIVGRDRELSQFGRMLGQHRLVTLTGPAGVGKSALALGIARNALARREADTFAGGVAVVDLSAVQGECELMAAVAAVLGQPSSGETVVDSLARRHSLLVLDNAETVIDECAGFVDRLLRRTRQTTVLVTSRELLGLPYEAVRQVRPLSLPKPADAADVARLAGVASVDLFVRRAAQVRPDFAVVPENASLIISVCRLLDGLPLGLELAAAALRIRQLRDLVDRLSDPLDQLMPARRGAPAHHGTLRSAVLRSAHSLGREEQVTLAALSTLTGEFCQHRAGPVLRHALGGGTAELAAVLDQLVDKSLLMVRHDRVGSRYRMLRTVRALGRELCGSFASAGQAFAAADPCVLSCRCAER